MAPIGGIDVVPGKTTGDVIANWKGLDGAAAAAVGCTMEGENVALSSPDFGASGAELEASTTVNQL